MNQQTLNTKVVTGVVRLSFVHLFKPYTPHPGQEPKYSVTLLIPKTDIKTKNAIDDAIQAAIQLGINTKWGGIRPAQPKHPVWDGDGLRQNGEPFGPECKGHWVLTASTKTQPQIVDRQLQPILDQTEVYSGMYALVSLNFFPYFNSGNKGVGCGLNNVMKVADGEPLGGRTTAEEDFANVEIPLIPQQYVQPSLQYAAQAIQFGEQAKQPSFQQPAYQYSAQNTTPPWDDQHQYQAVDPITGQPIR